MVCLLPFAEWHWSCPVPWCWPTTPWTTRTATSRLAAVSMSSYYTSFSVHRPLACTAAECWCMAYCPNVPGLPESSNFTTSFIASFSAEINAQFIQCRERCMSHFYISLINSQLIDEGLSFPRRGLYVALWQRNGNAPDHNLSSVTNLFSVMNKTVCGMSFIIYACLQMHTPWKTWYWHGKRRR